MEIFKNRYVLVLSLLAAILISAGIYAYASKSYVGNNNDNKKITDNKSESTKPNAQKTEQAQNNNPANRESQQPKTVSAPVKVKGVYLTGWTAGTKSKISHFIDLLNKTELNTLVIDVKDDEGRVTYKSGVPLAKEIGSSLKMVSDINALLKQLKDNKVHTIARIVVFKDPILAQKRPDTALKNKDGSLWRGRGSILWLNPSNTESWKYSIDLAKEAAQLGFDEIQFDYVRYPSEGKVKTIDYGEPEQTFDKRKAINSFLAEAKKELEPLGVPVSADVFGIITTDYGDVEKIGQDIEQVGLNIDYISPMVYPSHYALGQYGIKKPDLEPYNVVYKSLSTAKTRIDKIPNYKAKIRPYLQDFTATWLGSGNYKKYTAEDVKTQIKAAYDSGLDEWILWSASNKYDESAFKPE